MPPVLLNLTKDDFVRLSVASTRWKSGDWQEYAAHFENDIGSQHEDIDWTWEHVYFLGPDRIPVILARSYLDAIGQPYQVIWDTEEGPYSGYLLLTNYDPYELAQTPETSTGEETADESPPQ